MIDSKVNKAAGRSRRELILMILSSIVVVGLFPFVVIRVLENEWLHAGFNLAIVLAFVANGFYVYKTGKDKMPRMVFALSIVFAMFFGFYLKGGDEIPWSYPAFVFLFFAVKPKIAAFFCSICVLWISFILLPTMEIFEFATYISTLIVTAMAVYVFASITNRQRIALMNLSRRDPLTNLLNRRAFDYKVSEIIGTVRLGQPNSLILFDIDFFKTFNDEFGHAVGDEVLIKLGQLVTERMRRTDRVFRIGGEEFAVILTNSSENSATIVAEDIRQIIANAEIVETKRVTISLGVAEYCADESMDSWYRRCDEALYRAKESGRNNCKLAHPPEKVTPERPVLVAS